MSDWGEIGCFALIFWIFFSSKQKQRIREEGRVRAEARRAEAWDAQLRRAEDVAAGRAERPIGPAWSRRTAKQQERRKLNVDPMTGTPEPIEPDGKINEGDVRNGPSGYQPGAYQGGLGAVELRYNDDEGSNR